MANDTKIYRDIAMRAGGDIYIGVVGPVRTGKSTFIKKFMEAAVLPNITEENERTRAMDEMPQSASGKTVTTTEPKFVPDDGISFMPDGKTSMKIRLVDCVGYVVDEALGLTENGEPRMVHTPWSESPLPFAEAAEIGTRKVIREHSTVGILVTTDGTIGEIPRENYEAAEAKVVAELRRSEKPFAILLNSANPESDKAVSLAYELERKYEAPVALVNCMELNEEDIRQIFSMLLGEFPITELSFSLPLWTKVLPEGHPVKESIRASVLALGDRITRICDLENALLLAGTSDEVERWELKTVAADTGKAEIAVTLAPELYYRVASELSGLDVKDEASLLPLLAELAEKKRAYERVESALAEVEEKGYGIVMPSPAELSLCEPEIVKRAGGYGVKLRASARSIHMIRADIETEISPMVGSEARSEELVRSLLGDFESNPDGIWQTNMFGKSLYELVGDGLNEKLSHIPEDSRTRLSETLSRIINEGSNGLICILL